MQLTTVLAFYWYSKYFRPFKRLQRNTKMSIFYSWVSMTWQKPGCY